MRVFLFIGLFLIKDFVHSQDIDLAHLKCLVCRATMDEMEAAVSKLNPRVLVDAGNYKMDAQGNTVQKKVPLRKSQVHISDIVDDICSKMKDYVRGIKKYNKKLTIFNIVLPSGGMNPEMSKVDLIHDGDLNKSLEFYCHLVVEQLEDDIISLYVNDVENKKEKLCTEHSHICDNYPEEPFDDNDINSFFQVKDKEL
ncbi:protein seele [Harpegnathos saltator]|uniref:protein seele n=1 Tax=Harpegnathos saltator TaxID=610380 RepID=UPI00058B0988|nr:protein seele [Harpegnathos saltator]